MTTEKITTAEFLTTTAEKQIKGTRSQILTSSYPKTTNLFTVSAERCILYCRTNAIAYKKTKQKKHT